MVPYHEPEHHNSLFVPIGSYSQGWEVGTEEALKGVITLDRNSLISEFSHVESPVPPWAVVASCAK